MPAWNQDFLTEVLVALGLLILCTLGYKTIAWFRQGVRGSVRREEDALVPFREAMEAGEISREEFERVRDALQRHRSQASDEAALSPQTPSDDSRTVDTPSVDPF